MKNLKYKATTKAGQVVNVTVEAILDLNETASDTAIKAEYNGKTSVVRFSNLNNIPSISLNKYQVEEMFGVKIKCDANIVLDRDYINDYTAFKKEAAEMKKAAVKTEIEKLIQENASLEIISHWVMDRRMYSVMNVPRLVSNELSNTIEKAVKAGKIKMIGSGDMEDSREDGSILIADLFQAEVEIDRKKAAEKKELEEKKAEKLEVAKIEAVRTGKDVIISSYAVDCDGSEADCGCDLITTYVTPTLEIKTERVHTY